MEKNKLKHRVCNRFLIQCMLVLSSFLSLVYSAPKDVVVIFRGYEPGEDRLFSGIRKELAAQYNLFDMIITPDSKWKEFDFAIRRWNPQLVILTGTLPVRQFVEYCKKVPDKSSAPISLLIVNTQTLPLQSKIPNSTAIILDVPVTTSLLSIQSVFDTPLKHPGIIHTRIFDTKVDMEKSVLKRHGITLSDVSINGKPSELSARIQESISKLIDTVHIDCLILPDDPGLFQRELFPVWQSCLNQLNIPVVTNRLFPDFDSIDFIACTFFPDTVSTIAQISQKVKRIQDCGWKMENITNEYSIPIKKTANIKILGQFPNISGDLYKTFDILKND